MKEIQAFTHTGSLIKQTNNLLFYDTHTSRGQSGSPVYYLYKGINYVVGIHTHGDIY